MLQTDPLIKMPHPGLVAIKNFVTSEDQSVPPELKVILAQNISAILGSIELGHKREHTDYDFSGFIPKNAVHNVIRVQNGVINIYTGRLLLRHPTTAPDGFYYGFGEIDENTVPPSKYDFIGYPDLEPYVPTFEDFTASGPVKVTRAECQMICDWLYQAHKDKCTVILDSDGMHLDQDEDVRFRFPLNLLRPTKPIYPKSLGMAFREAHRYECVYVGQAYDRDRPLPLLIGSGISKCVLVSTRGTRVTEAVHML